MGQNNSAKRPSSPAIRRAAAFRYTFADCVARAKQLANALTALGLSPGDVVGSLAWNTHRHLEAYFAVSGNGMVMHTCNPRLLAGQLIYIINHADDVAMLFDVSFAPLISAIAAQCPKVKAWICLSAKQGLAQIDGISNLVCYEDLLTAQSSELTWPRFDEGTAAALCYTSGTTGTPKGCLYSHRSIILNALTICLPGMLSFSPRDTVLPVVPMFHVNAWSIPYAAFIGGAKLVLPGQRLDGAGLHELMESEKVTVSAGVPSIWSALMQYVEHSGLQFSTMRRIGVGGSAMPKSLTSKFADQYQVDIRHGWGMTETGGGVAFSCLNTEQLDLPADDRHTLSSSQGRPMFGIEIKIVDGAGRELPRDGKAQGELMARGHSVISTYFKEEVSPLVDGWFPTGDIASIDEDGNLHIKDRLKDLIKSGGEWISSIELEDVAMTHPAVAAAAVISVSHPKWQERPLLLAVLKSGQDVSKTALLAHYSGRVAKWAIPDDVVFLPSLPLGGTGKVQKEGLREAYRHSYWDGGFLE